MGSGGEHSAGSVDGAEGLLEWEPGWEMMQLLV